MQVRAHLLVPVIAAAAATASLVAASPARADCNYSGGSTLCSSGGEVRGGGTNSPSPSAPYSPYPCYDYGDPLCLYYDNYDPGIAWDLPNFGIGRPGNGGGGGRPGGGGGIGPR